MKPLPLAFASFRRSGGVHSSAPVRPSARRALACLAALAMATALSAKIPAGDPVVSQDENLLFNGDFTLRDGDPARPLRWKIGSSTTAVNALDAIVTRDLRIESTDPADTINASLKVMDNSTTLGVTLRSERRLAIPGISYTAKARVNEQGGTGTLYLEFRNAEDAVTQHASGALTPAPDGNTAWKEATVTAIAPVDAVHVSVSIRTGTTATGTSYWDSVTLRPQLSYDKNLVLGQREFFIDDYRLEASFDVQRMVQPPVKAGRVVQKDKSWESPSLMLVYTVLRDEAAGLYKMWYYSNGRMLYATSPDGLAWFKPPLGNYTYGSGTNNNIAFEPGQGRITVVHTPADAGKEFKALRHAGPTSGYHYYHSASGTGGWTIGNGGAPVIDSANVSSLAYDAAQARFIATTRQPSSDLPTGISSLGDRIVFISSSPDMVTWTSPGYAPAPFSPAVEGDRADDFRVQSRRHIDLRAEAMPVFPYGSVYLGFPSMFELTDFTTGASADTLGNGSTYPQLASSRDLRVWHRPSRTPIIPLGKKGEWDGGGIIGVSSGLVEGTDTLGKKWLYVYYSGNNLGRGGDYDGKTVESSIGLAKWEPERLVAISNRGYRTDWMNHDTGVPQTLIVGNEGFITTKTIRCPTTATKLRINTHVQPPGTTSTLSRVRVEVLDAATDLPVPGFAFANATSVGAGDRPNQLVAWSGNPSFSAIINKDIKLRFYLLNADLFAYWFEE